MDRKQIAREIVEESVVLLKNEGQILPFSKQQKIAFFGRAQLQTYTSGNGSGATKGAKENNILLACEKAGICVHAQLKSYYLTALQEESERPEEEFDFAHMKDLIHSGLMYEVFGKYHAPAKEYDISEELLRNVRSFTETAVVIIGRNAGGEECDRHLKNDYELTESEKRLIDQVCGTFQKVVLILNINGLIDLKWTKQYPAVKGILFLGIPGEEGAAALAEILLGAVNPSGKLSVTIAENFEDYPSARHFSWDKDDPEQLLTYESYGMDALKNGSCGFEKSPVTVYEEDIYAGYRYFDTFCKKPLYPFGFGLSYTRFEIEVQHIQEQECGVRIEVQVKNVGSCSGKEVVQMYLSAENTKEERAYQELKGFEKTKLLKPGESETVSLWLPWEEFSYYDEEQAAFRIGKGIYKVRIGDSSAHTELVGTIEVRQEYVVKQCANRLGIKECNLGKIMFRTENNTKIFNRKEYSLQEKNYIPDETMDLSELSIDELAALCVGYGSGVPFSAFGEGDDPETVFDKNGRPLTCNSHPTGMNGYVSPAILEKGIYSVSYKDGPAGIGRTAWPSEMLIAYSGEELLPETSYRVHISVEDNHGNRAEGEMQFETGIFSTQDFQAEMITHDFPDEETACPVFERTFAISKKVRRARVFATAQGVYELVLNGCRIGADRMTPGWTSYHHRLQYQIYDITEYLKAKNRLEMTVGNGWYKGILGFYCQPNIYGNRVGAFAEIHLFYEDGSREVIATDESWTVRTGEIRYSEIYMGEMIDTENPSIAEGRVSIKEFNKAVLTAQENEPVRITERIPAKALIETKKGEHVVDFGQNLTGLVELKIHGRKGQKIQIRHAEVLDKDGNFYPDTLREAKSVDTYICNGKEQVFLPHFTFHGFRYIAVEGIEEMKLEQFTACVMHSDMEKTGDFVCSNDKVCQLQSNIAWGQRGNFLDIPTDCPQRDERLGWMGDAGVFSWTAAFNRNTALFFAKWMRDIAVESSAEKGVPQVVPDIIGQYSASVWNDAAVIIPWVVYQTYGDKRILEESWKCMHEWIDYITRQCGEKGLWLTGFQYGDWLALDAERCREISEGATDKYMIANAYYLYVTDLVRQTAEALGKEEDAKKYKDLYERTLLAFRREYYTPAGRSVSETQTGSALSLRFNLAYEKDRAGITETLVRNIQEHKNHLCTGFVGTPHLCHALSENGAHEIAAAIFMKEDYPSWLYAVNMGATTVWERWDAIQPDGTMEGAGLNSMNHYAYGSIGDWMYRKIAGLSQLEPGYKKFRIQPRFVTGIEEAGVELESVYGKIESQWSCKNGKITVKVVVPPNTTAEIRLPEKEEIFEVGSGSYEYVYDTETCLAVGRFSLDSKFGELLADPLGAKLLNEMIPEIVNNPMIEYIKNMTVTETLGMTPDRKSDYMEVIRRLNKQ